MENAFGILAHRWRILLRPMEFERNQVISTTKACIVLHNILCAKSEARGRYLNPSDLEREDGQGNTIAATTVIHNKRVNFVSNRATDEAHRVRKLLAEYFVSSAGAVPWQERITSSVLET